MVANSQGQLFKGSQEGADMSFPRVDLFSRVFDDTATSYKLFWFRGILECLKRQWTHTGHETAGTLSARDIVSDMVAAAWAPTCMFRLSLGHRDQLGKLCRRISTELPLDSNLSTREVRFALTDDVFVRFGLHQLLQFVPALFQAPWFSAELRPFKGGRERAKHARRLAIEHCDSDRAAPYILSGTGADMAVTIKPNWLLFFQCNLGVLEGFLDHHLAVYLQARNPHSPGIVRKLRVPTRRDLRAASHFWKLVMTRAVAAGTVVRDIYSDLPINSDFEIDHFLPWTFVAHDQLWNLVPVTPPANAQKGDAIPDPRYLEKAADLHWTALTLASDQPKQLLDYEVHFQTTVAGLIRGGVTAFRQRYEALLTPQMLVAETQGFESGWVFRCVSELTQKLASRSRSESAHGSE